MAHEDSTKKIGSNTLFLLAVNGLPEDKKEDCRRFYWSELQRPHKMLNGHRSITVTSHRKNKWLRQRDSKKTRQNNKRRDAAYRTMQSVLASAATLTTIIATAGRHTLRRPTTEDLCIQKRKGAGTTGEVNTTTDERGFTSLWATTDD